MKGYQRPVETPRLYLVEGGSKDMEPGVERTERVPPPVTLGMLGVIIAVFLAMWISGHGDVLRVAGMFGDKETRLIQAGQWWRLIIPIFLHGSWAHLIVNGISLVWFGSQIERLYGGRKYFLIYIAAGVAGNVLSYLRLPSSSLGASGALFGLIGAALVFPIRYRNLLPAHEREAILKQLALVAVINLSLSFVPGIDLYAHIGGFLGGAFMALLLVPDVLDPRPRNALREAVLTLLTLLTLLLVIVAAGRQWGATQAERQTRTVTYSLGKPQPWWHFDLSARWRPVTVAGQVGMTWVGPAEARITLQDSDDDPDLFERLERWKAETGITSRSVAVDGHLAVLSALRDRGQVTRMCEIIADGHHIALTLTGTEEENPEATHDFEALLNSIRIVPPPRSPATQGER